MKHSGIPWIGEIPVEWSIARLKNEGTLHGRIGWNGLRSDEFEDNSYAYLITGQDFISSNIDWSRCYQIRKERYDEDEFIQLIEGDLLITKDGTIGKVAVVSNMDKPACLNSGIFVLRQKNQTYTPRYLYWFLASPMLKTYNDYMNLGGTTIIHLYQNVFERMPILIPPYLEQQSIADFLDKKCGEIDEMVSLQEKIVEELKAYKQSVISEAVCKGLNPDVPMKDSGIEWIGKIPMSWRLLRIKNLSSFLNGYAFDSNAFRMDNPVPVIRIGDISSSLDYELCVKVENKEELSCFEIQDGDILIAMSGATTGKCCYVINPSRAYINQRVGIIRGKWNRFLFYSLQAAPFFEYISLNSAGSAQPNISAIGIGNHCIAAPDLEEALLIADYLDTKCAEIDTLISLKQSKIEALKEYKKSIIYEYITGKKDING